MVYMQMDAFAHNFEAKIYLDQNFQDQENISHRGVMHKQIFGWSYLWVANIALKFMPII